jgi:2-dehydropantoate 2-reductase
MRVLVMGAGAIGGYFGGLLAQSGHEVAFVARGAHLAAMRKRGLEIRSNGKTSLLRPVSAVESPAEAGSGFDLILFTVKSYDTESAAAALKPAVGGKTAVLTLQNGIDSVDQLSAALGGEHVLAGAALIESTIVSPGVIDQPSPFRKIVLGELPGQITPRLEAIAVALREAGAEVVVSADARLVVWEKFVVLAPNATLTSACQAAVGPIRETIEGAALYRALIEEAVAVGRAEGVALPPNAADAAMAIIMSVPATMKTSMQRDYERQRRVELDQLAGAVVRRGRAADVPTPAFATLYAVLKVRALEFGGLS